MDRLPQQLHHVEQRSTGIQLTERKNDGKKKTFGRCNFKSS